MSFLLVESVWFLSTMALTSQNVPWPGLFSWREAGNGSALRNRLSRLPIQLKWWRIFKGHRMISNYDIQGLKMYVTSHEKDFTSLDRSVLMD